MSAGIVHFTPDAYPRVVAGPAGALDVLLPFRIDTDEPNVPIVAYRLRAEVDGRSWTPRARMRHIREGFANWMQTKPIAACVSPSASAALPAPISARKSLGRAASTRMCRASAPAGVSRCAQPDDAACAARQGAGASLHRPHRPTILCKPDARDEVRNGRFTARTGNR